ncbi:MAG: radical SAM protein [Phycisphaerae bacterium]|jgi:radical SAM superfamily enzyme YgiQ (UPF0313 family)
MSRPADCLLWCPDVLVARGRFKPSHYLGILYIARVAEAGGYEPRVILHGHDLDAVAAEVERVRPRIVGVSVTDSQWRSNLPLAVALCRQVKRQAHPPRTVLGGLLATMFADEIMARHADVDIVVRGEGEETFLEILAERPLDQIAGIAYRDECGTIHHTPPRPPLADLDHLPHALAVESEATATTECAGLLGNVRYAPAEQCASIMTGRGCRGACTFCVNPWYYKPVRRRSIAGVADEIAQLSLRGVRFLRVCDADFADGAERVMQFCDAVRPFGMQWSCWQRADMTDAAAYRAMRRSGCRNTTFGIESFDPEIRNRGYGKGISDERLAQAIGNASRAGLDTIGEIIIGHPQEDAARLREGLRRARHILRHLDYVNISFLSITPHTALWRQMTAEMPAGQVQRLRLRAMHEFPSVWRFVQGVRPGALEAISEEYLRSVYHNPLYLLRQCGRIVTRRKRLVWRNRKEIARFVGGKVALAIASSGRGKA